MKKILFTVLIASTAFTVRTFFVVDASVHHHLAANDSLSVLPVQPLAPAEENAPTPPSAPISIVNSTTAAPIESLSFEALNKLNDSVDPDKSGFQPYYIQSFMLAGTGSYFAATNVSADTLTSGNATIGSLTIEDGGTIEGTLNASDIRAEKITAQVGITLYDQVTGEPHCLAISSGAVSANTGACAE